MSSYKNFKNPQISSISNLQSLCSSVLSKYWSISVLNGYFWTERSLSLDRECRKNVRESVYVIICWYQFQRALAQVKIKELQKYTASSWNLINATLAIYLYQNNHPRVEWNQGFAKLES